MTIDISNIPYETVEQYGPAGQTGNRFSDNVGDYSLLNTECRVYWVSPGVEGFAPYDNPDYYSHDADAFLAFSGYIRKYEHSETKARIVAEDKTEFYFHKDLPLSTTNALGAGPNIPSKYKNKYSVYPNL